MDKEIEVVRPQAIEAQVAGHTMTTAEAQQHWERLKQFIKNNLKPGVDYGTAAGGSKKPSLWRPGAEKIAKFFGFGAELIRNKDSSVIDWAKPFFNFDYQARIFNYTTGKTVALADGSANSLEDRFRWQWVSEKKLPRGINKDELEFEERSGDYGAYKVYRIPVLDPYSQVNNIQKRAGKRALVAGVLIACAASDFFDASKEEDDDEEEAPRQKGGQRAADPSGYNESEKISEARLKRYHAIKAKSGKTDDEILAFFTKNAPYCIVDGAVKPERISFKHYDAICNWLEGKA